ncbi:MAG: DNA-binding response regulator [Puniceicoccaceae bacterium]|nr:DNA-binding response regulator [Puniceicoccaceae bacterium]RCL30489.1 MAG: sigma-54-dependent Fis family transcriptional regulator [Puniceicoccaceae bacterium]
MRILIVDDEEALRYSLKRALSNRDLQVFEADSGELALEVAEKNPPHIILLDNRMGGMTGIEALQHLRGICPEAKIIIMTAFTTTQTTIEAMKFGAFDYIMKPFDVAKILGLVDSAIAVICEASSGNIEDESVEAIIEEDVKVGIIGNAPAMQDVYKMIGQVSSSDVTVLVTGESGTGKELIARAIHKNSLRAHQPFIAVNCSAIPENLIESELFGHEKGSFTGASQQRIGYFEQCDRGTIFLDEIGDMPLPAQTKILRALQEGEIQRVGGSETVRVDVRILAATNQSIESMVKEQTFREDLYYRLNVVRIQMPALRQRREDIHLLINFILKNLSKKNPSVADSVAKEALDLLIAYSWPGNVRELENVVHRSAVLAQGKTILVKDLPQELLEFAEERGEAQPVKKLSQAPCSTKLAPPAPEELSERLFESIKQSEPNTGLLKVLEAKMIQWALVDCKGVQAKAAKLLGLTTATLKKRIRDYGIHYEE